MKKSLAVLILLMTMSCVSTKYNVYEMPNNFTNIQVGNKYTIYDLKDHKFFVDVNSVTNDSIIGSHKNQRIALAKKDIKEIKKNKTTATVALIGGSVVIIGGIWIITNILKDLNHAFGKVLGG